MDSKISSEVYKMVNMPRYQRGVSFVLWAVALIPLMGFAVLAIDINRLFLASGELQHAADAGAMPECRP